MHKIMYIRQNMSLFTELPIRFMYSSNHNRGGPSSLGVKERDIKRTNDGVSGATVSIISHFTAI